LAYFLSAHGVVEVDKLPFDSPALRTLKEAGVKVAVPLVSQGELIGLLNLGPRLSEQDYSLDDHRLLNNLATQAAPALRVAQLARQQQVEARQRERLEQELRVARVIQQTLLPKEIPSLAGYHLEAHWQPARAVSGDFYDFIQFSDGKIALVVGDVTDKGVPAALVMATTRSILRTAAEQFLSPCLVLQQANNMLCPDIPPNMFVTCLYAVLEPSTGRLQYANAGHIPPYQRTADAVNELRATGMPLGLLPDMNYEEKETVLSPGDSVIIFSDGLVEAHNQHQEMFGFPRLRRLLEEHSGGSRLIEFLLQELDLFTGQGWEQEDDVTFVSLEYMKIMDNLENEPQETGAQLLAAFELPSQPGNERQAMERVAEIVRQIELPPASIERLKTAVAEGTMNAMEHGNKYQAEKPVSVRVLVDGKNLIVQITDQGGGKPIPESNVPNLEAKLEGLQSPRGWGLFLIKNMVDDLRIIVDDNHHTLELILNLEGVKHDN
jgi:serine phosphatase RsbU (regulator of sigma subunit)/anti-sigma regulatory factor (Ser/Thr protein kinase)